MSQNNNNYHSDISKIYRSKSQQTTTYGMDFQVVVFNFNMRRSMSYKPSLFGARSISSNTSSALSTQTVSPMSGAMSPASHRGLSPRFTFEDRLSNFKVLINCKNG